MSLPELSIRRPVFMTMVLVLLVLLGIVSYQKMDVNEMPDASYPFVSVSVTYDGAQPEQIDEQVVRKIEEAVSEAKGVRHITSTSTEGSADVGIEFKIGIDPAEAAQDVRDKVSAVRGDLPDGVKEPVISRFDMNAAPVAAIALTTEDGDLRELSAFVNDTLKPQLQKVAGIGQIQVSGNTKREVELLLSQDKLNEYGLAISDVAASLKAVNQDIPAGNFDNSGRQTAVRTAGAFRSLNDVYRAELATRGAQPILFEQVGMAKDTVKEATALCRYDGTPAIGIEIGKQSGGNAVRVAADVKKTLDRLKDDLPAGVSVHLVRDDVARITQSMDDVWEDLILGGFFAVVIVFWFLGDWHSTVISALAIPTSIAAAFTFMHLGHFSINTMSLLGLSLSVGLLIDDAIVVVENIIRHRQMGKDAKTAALDGTKEIVLPVMATTFSVAAVFLPVGKPAMPTFLKQPWQRFQTAFTALEAWYRGVLHHILEHERKRVMAGAVALLAVSLFVLTQIGQEFTPTSDQSQFTLRVNAPRGESVTAAGRDLEAVRAALAEVPGVLHVYQRSDTQDANFFVQLVPKADRDRTQDEIVRDCRARVNVANLATRTSRSISACASMAAIVRRPRCCRTFSSPQATTSACRSRRSRASNRTRRAAACGVTTAKKRSASRRTSRTRRSATLKKHLQMPRRISICRPATPSVQRARAMIWTRRSATSSWRWSWPSCSSSSCSRRSSKATASRSLSCCRCRSR